MPGSYVCLRYHFVFSTKHRRPHITGDLRDSLWPYLGGILRNLRGVALAVGGTADHVHVLAGLHQDEGVSAILRRLKASSSRWVHETYGTSEFGWQEGYWGFTLGPDATESLRQYIKDQEQHHRHVSFQDEVRQFLRQHGIEHDERYMWE